MNTPHPLIASILFLWVTVCSADEPHTTVAKLQPDLGGFHSVISEPQVSRISGLACNGKDVWGFIYHGGGRYALLNRDEQNWELVKDVDQLMVIRQASGRSISPGGACFLKEELWIVDSYGGAMGSIDTKRWKVTRRVTGSLMTTEASQSYSGVAHDGKHVWIAWHWFKSDFPASLTQVLLKMEPDTGQVINKYPLPAGTPRDGAHGLTWDGNRLWHMKDQTLTAIDPSDGSFIEQYELKQVKRPSGLTWTGHSLMIAEFDGYLWELPFKKTQE